jgi:hypothetical protein
MTLALPILMNHDASKPIGSFVDGHVVLREGHEIAEPALARIFGNGGFSFVPADSFVVDGVRYLRRFMIHEFSVTADQLTPIEVAERECVECRAAPCDRPCARVVGSPEEEADRLRDRSECTIETARELIERFGNADAAERHLLERMVGARAPTKERA